MNRTKQEEDLERFFSIADAWFAKFGEVSVPAHQELKKLLLESIPAAKAMDYELDAEGRAVNVTIYVSVNTILFGRPKRLAENVVEILKECLDGYEINVSVRRYQKKAK